MNEVLKQRLVGALILVALGVVFWPIIFVQPESDAGSEHYAMPPGPRVDTSPVPAPDEAGLRGGFLEQPGQGEPAGGSQPVPDESAAQEQTDPAPPVASAPAPARAAPKSAAERLRQEPPVEPAIDADGVPVAWMLQVASVSSQDKAEQLRDRLVGLGHKAYFKKIPRNGKTLWRVYIGPKFEKAKLEAIRTEVDAAVGVQSLVVRYYP